MAERTIVKPLSGDEIIESIVTKIRSQLARDCFLNPHLAYASFSYQAEIRVQFQNTGTAIKETYARASGQGGDEQDDIDTESIDVSVSEVPKSPNDVRVEAGIGVPVLATKPSGGIQEKRVKYDPKGAPAKTARKALAQK